MASKPVEAPVSSWASPASSLRIEYSAEVMEEIRARAVEGFYRLTRGGVEIAGLLLGTVQDGSTRILAQLPFEIEYAYGPVFALSPRDIAYIRKLLEDLANPHSPEAAQSRGMRVLGLYVSHSRSALSVSEGEIALFDQLFPHAWQTVLLLKPSRSPETAAAFVVRGADGKIYGGEPPSSFLVAPAMGERRARPPRTASSSLQALAEAASSASAPEPTGRNPAIPAPADDDVLARRALPIKDPPVSSTPEAAPPGREPLAKAPLSRVLSAALGEDLVPQKPPALETSSPEQPPAAPVGPPPVPPAVAPPEPAPAAAQFAAEGKPAGSSPLEPDAPEAQPLPDWHDEAQIPKAPRATSWLRWAIPVLGMALLLVLGYLVYHALNSVPPSVVFYTKESGDRLEIIWQLKGLSDAQRAEIAVRSGNETRRIDLIRTGQLSGTYSDPFLKRDSEVWLEVERAGGDIIRRTSPLIPADSVVAYLGGEAVGAGAAPATQVPEPVAVETPSTPAGQDTLSPEIKASQPAGTLIAEPIPAVPVGNQVAEPKPVPPPPPAQNPPDARGLTARETTQQRIAVATQTPAAAVPSAPASATTGPRDPEAPIQARITEAPPARVAQQNSLSAAANRPAPPLAPQPSNRAAPNSPGTQAAPPAAGTARPNLPASPVATERPQPTAAKPALRAGAGRMIWTGQLRKNQSLQISGKEANQGVLNAALPGQPVRINVLPGELTSQGLVVYTANPRYRNAQNAVEAPGPTNGWNQTRYRYDPARANSLIVTGVPAQGNNWQGITVRNDDKSTNVIVIDWQAAEP